MDELRIRVGQFSEGAQSRINMAGDSGMRVVRQYSDEARGLAMRVLHDPNNVIRNHASNIWNTILEYCERLGNITNLRIMQMIFEDEIARNNAYFILVGLTIGTAGGFMLGVYLGRESIPHPIMKAVACLAFKGKDITLTKVPLPRLRTSSDVLIRVRAASINRMDARIAKGYGQVLRQMIQKYDKRFNRELPLILGRSCSGVVESVGPDCKNGLEIGDEIWLASNFYETGLASQLVVTNESRVGRKPFLIGFEGAASLPYDGCLAIHGLKQANLNEVSCMGKRVLVQDGCSPVGVILTQLLKKWGAHVTTTCHSRSAPVVLALGADDVITFSNENFETDLNIEQSTFLTSLVTRENFDVVFFTTHLNYDKGFIYKFLHEDGVVVDTWVKELSSDSYGVGMRWLLSIYVSVKKACCRVFRLGQPNWANEPSLCSCTLDQLASYINDEILNTVVDQVFNPVEKEVEQAVNHVLSEKRIGSTIITFR